MRFSDEDMARWEAEQKARDESDRAAIEARPCRAGVEAEDHDAGLDACDKAGAWRACPARSTERRYELRYTNVWCPFRDRAERYGRAHGRLAKTIPPLAQETIAASLPSWDERTGERTPPTAPLIETAALQIVRAFVRQSPAEVPTGRTHRARVEGDEVLLVLAGPPGCGKTLAAAWALAWKDGQFLDAPALAWIHTDMEALADLRGLLILDDTGQEPDGPSGWAADRLAGLLVRRHLRLAPTIVTTNLKRADFARRYGPRLDDRLNERALFVELGGASLRGKGRRA